MLQVGLVVSSATIGPLSTILGRRAILVVGSVISFVGLTLQVVVTTQWPVYIGRLLLGPSRSAFFTCAVPKLPRQVLQMAYTLTRPYYT